MKFTLMATFYYRLRYFIQKIIRKKKSIGQCVILNIDFQSTRISLFDR